MRTLASWVRCSLAMVLSGAAALVYESSWARLCQRVFGVSDLAVATVIGAFFAGLALGGVFGARLVTRSWPLQRVYAALELGIALYAAASLALIPSLHGVLRALGPDPSAGALRAVELLLALVVLVPPTTLMGATLPVLVSLVARDHSAWSGSATRLYVSNTVGALLGAAVSGFWLLPSFGTRRSVLIAALCNVVAAALVGARGEAAPEPRGAADTLTRGPSGRVVALAAVTGFSALAGEVVWTRVLRIIFEGTTQAFAAMLTCYLAGIALGGALARAWRRVIPNALAALAATQLCAAVATLWALSAAPHAPRLAGLLAGRAVVTPAGAAEMLALAMLLLLPLTLATGAAVPLAWDIACEEAGRGDRVSGEVLAANTVGGLGGSLAMALVVIPSLGVDGSAVLLLLVHAFTGALALRSAQASPAARGAAFALPLVFAAAALARRPSVDLPFLLGGRSDPPRAIVEGPGPRWSEGLLYLREGRNTTVTVVRTDRSLMLFNDGRKESGFNRSALGYNAVLVLLGAAPTLFSERLGSSMVVGLGAGHSTSVLLSAPWERVEAVELEEAVVEAARVLHRARGRRFPLDDPRARLRVDDARMRLVLADDHSLDAVVSQPSHPWLAGSSALYTREFFADVRRALREGGVFSLWVNLFRIEPRHVRAIVATLRSEFPHVLGLLGERSGLVLCASASPLRWDGAAARIGTPHFREQLGAVGLDSLPRFMSVVEFDDAGAERLSRGAALISDDRPLLEFELAHVDPSRLVAPSELDAALGGEWLSAATIRSLPEGARVEALLARVERVDDRPLALEGARRALAQADLTPQQALRVRAALASALGRDDEALELYVQSGTPEALLSAARIELDQGASERALTHALAAQSLPEAQVVALLAALASGDAEHARLALASVAEAPEHRALRALLATYAQDGCAAVRGRTWEALPHPAWRATLRCAEGLDEITARAFEAQHARAAAAAAWERRAERRAAGGNREGALGALRRALQIDPFSRSAAARSREWQQRPPTPLRSASGAPDDLAP